LKTFSRCASSMSKAERTSPTSTKAEPRGLRAEVKLRLEKASRVPLFGE